LVFGGFFGALSPTNGIAMTLDNRSFFEMAAAVAQEGADFKKRINKSLEPDEVILRSNLLESDYQDCLFAFKALGHRIPSLQFNSLVVANVLNKFSQGRIIEDADMLLSITPNTFGRDLAMAWQRASHVLDQPDDTVFVNGLDYEPKELMALVLWIARYAFMSISYPAPIFMSAPLFHDQLTRMAHQKVRRPFVFSGILGEKKLDIHIDRASLFSANRLKKKTWQNSIGAEPGVRYYHAALKSSLTGCELDIIYWLKFDEEHRLLEGQFINMEKIAEPYLLRACFWSPYEYLSKEASGYERIHGMPSTSDRLVREVFGMYLASLIN